MRTGGGHALCPCSPRPRLPKRSCTAALLLKGCWMRCPAALQAPGFRNAGCCIQPALGHSKGARGAQAVRARAGGGGPGRKTAARSSRGYSLWGAWGAKIG